MLTKFEFNLGESFPCTHTHKHYCFSKTPSSFKTRGSSLLSDSRHRNGRGYAAESQSEFSIWKRTGDLAGIFQRGFFDNRVADYLATKRLKMVVKNSGRYWEKLCDFYDEILVPTFAYFSNEGDIFSAWLHTTTMYEHNNYVQRVRNHDR